MTYFPLQFRRSNKICKRTKEIICSLWLRCISQFEPCLEKTCSSHVSTKVQISLRICNFVVGYSDNVVITSIVPILAIGEISRFYLVAVAEQAGLNLTCTWSETQKTDFLVTWLMYL